MDLLCIEVECEPRAYGDPVFLDDDRVLSNLLLSEDRYLLSSCYFKCLQTELKTYMRRIVASWMLEVSLGVCNALLATFLSYAIKGEHLEDAACVSIECVSFDEESRHGGMQHAALLSFMLFISILTL